MYLFMGKYQAGVGCEGGFSMGVATGDSENDGRTDLYVADYGEKVLYHHRGSDHPLDRAPARVARPVRNPGG